ncbi:MarR family transcriptional regulator [Streptomyces sp. FXJ1.4098]|nr:MarR family transcriptional regulator [Streptomyces sp. FXJ1.4098]
MGHTRWLNEDEMHAWKAFTNTHALLYRRLEQRLKRDFGLSGLQYEILARLSDAPDRELRMAELACALVNSKSGLTYQIGQLEKAGLVRRRSCPSDERAVYAVLTDDGVACWNGPRPATSPWSGNCSSTCSPPTRYGPSPTASARRAAA